MKVVLLPEAEKEAEAAALWSESRSMRLAHDCLHQLRVDRRNQWKPTQTATFPGYWPGMMGHLWPIVSNSIVK